MATPGKLVELTIQSGGSLPSATVNGNDSVFWLNSTGETHDLVYNSPNGPVPWGQGPIAPGGTSSQVVFPNPSAQQVYSYSCTIHTSEKGTITVNPNT
jgi:plastocyanin